MDPNLFHVDLARLAEVLSAIVVLSFFVERALALIFESRVFVERYDEVKWPVKETLAFVVSFYLCYRWEFDALSILLVRDHMSWFGEAVTAGVISGGSKASIKLFHDAIGAMSTATAEKKAEKKKQRSSLAPGGGGATQPPSTTPAVG